MCSPFINQIADNILLPLIVHLELDTKFKVRNTMTLLPSIVAIVKVGDTLIRAPSRGRHGRMRVKDAMKFWWTYIWWV